MTHKDIYTKFMIEYDKANVTSSYPSLTEYEVATILDKAYNALIAQKITGNNVRKAPFEADVKSVSDLQPLVVKANIDLTTSENTNEFFGNLPPDFLYYVGGYVLTIPTIYDGSLSPTSKKAVPINNSTIQNLPLHVKLIDHSNAEKFIISANNIPWIKTPVCYIEDGKIYVVLDLLKQYDNGDLFYMTYVKTPNTFAKDLDYLKAARYLKDISYFEYEMEDSPTNSGNTYIDQLNTAQYNAEKTNIEKLYQFECNSTMAEELVSLAVAFALENVESQRLNSKLNMRGLEA